MKDDENKLKNKEEQDIEEQEEIVQEEKTEEITETETVESESEETPADDIEDTDEEMTLIENLVESTKVFKNINSKQMRINKLIVAALAMLCIGGIGDAYTMSKYEEKIQSQQEQIAELAEFNNYDLEEHKAIKTLSQINEDATKFKESDYFANHKLDAGMNRDLAFNVQGDTYYVLFYMKDCSHCNALESDMFDNISKVMKKDIFYYDAETFTEDSEFEWTDTNPGDKYTSTKREFKVYGTPTLVKVSPGTEKIKVFMGNEAIEEGLGLS